MLMLENSEAFLMLNRCEGDTFTQCSCHTAYELFFLSSLRLVIRD